MISIKNINFLPSEVVDMMRNAMTGWKEVYASYVLKIDMSGQRFFQYADLEETILKYISNEPKNDQPALARHRGKPLIKTSAIVLRPLSKLEVPQRDRAAIASLMATGRNDPGRGVTNMKIHQSDPETGKPKQNGRVGVHEYYINGANGRRATRRKEGTRTTYYYSDKHAFNSYKYQRLY